MRWRIVAVGKPRLPFARDGINEYFSRLKNYAPAEMELAKGSAPEKEGAQLLSLSEGCFRLVLDERGQSFTSRALADRIAKIERDSFKTCALVVGGSDGLSPDVRAKADLLWSLSPLTLQHELALLLALEQLYRAYTIQAGLPYHRD